MNNTRNQTLPQVDTTNSCPVCDHIARRDEKLIDALQTAMVALTAVDGYDRWEIRSARTRAALLVAMRLLQVKRW